MPCYYTGSAEGDASLAADEARKSLTSVTEMLCDLCKTCEDAGMNNLIEHNKKLSVWWKRHKKQDKRKKT